MKKDINSRRPLEDSLKACFDSTRFKFENSGTELTITMSSKITYVIDVFDDFLCIDSIPGDKLNSRVFRAFLANFNCMYNTSGVKKKEKKTFLHPILFLSLAKDNDNNLFILLSYYFYNYLPEVINKENMHLVTQEVLKKTNIFLDLQEE